MRHAHGPYETEDAEKERRGDEYRDLARCSRQLALKPPSLSPSSMKTRLVTAPPLPVLPIVRCAGVRPMHPRT